MRMTSLWMLVSTVVLAAPPQTHQAQSRQVQTQQSQREAAGAAVLASPDSRCPGGTVQGCVDGAAEAMRRGDAGKAGALNTAACEAKVGRACTALGEALLAGRGMPRDDAQAVRMLERACELRDARGCSSLGSAVWQGRGVKRADPARAYKLFMRGCDGGDGTGCFSAAICHRTGTCAPRSAAKAKTLLTRACDAGETRACSELGVKR